MQRGKHYEEFVNKFIRGKIVSDSVDEYDIEAKNYLYEVKGARIYHINTTETMSIGRYQIIYNNHKKIKTLAKKKKKIPKYIFVIKIANRYIFKSMEWILVDIIIKKEANEFVKQSGEKCFTVKLSSVW